MAIHKLTKTKIIKAKPRAKEYLLNDGAGLNLAIKPTGAKLWIFRYLSPTLNKQRKAGLGTYPRISLDLARDRAKEYQEMIKQGIDPIEQSQEVKKQEQAKDDELLSNLVDEWIKETKSTITLKTQKNIKSLFKNDVLPYLKSKNIKDIKHPELARALKIKHDKAPVMAEKLFRYCNELFQWACTKGICETNIILNIHRKSIIQPRITIHHKTITKEQELKKLIKSIYNLGKRHTKANALKFILHMPLRASNLTSLKWSFIDFEKRTLTIPREQMKVKDPNLNDFVLPLSDEVVSILKDQRESTTSRRFIFSSDRHTGKHINQATLNETLRSFNITLHGFRAMFRSLANTHAREHNVSEKARERALDYISETATQRAYTHQSDYFNELKILLSWWSEFIVDLRNKE